MKSIHYLSVICIAATSFIFSACDSDSVFSDRNDPDVSDGPTSFPSVPEDEVPNAPETDSEAPHPSVDENTNPSTEDSNDTIDPAEPDPDNADPSMPNVEQEPSEDSDDYSEEENDVQSPQERSPGNLVITGSENLIINQGKTAKFTIALEDEPTSDVSIAIASSNTKLGKIAPEQLVFNSNNWNTPQIVVITATTEPQNQKEIDYQIHIGPTVSSDIRYDALDISRIPITHISQIQGSTNIPVKKIEIKIVDDEPNLLFQGSLSVKAEVTPNNATDQTITWKLSKESETTAKLENHKGHETKLNGYSRKSQTVTLIATNEATNISATKEINLKPYLPLGFSRDEIIKKQIRDFNIPSCFNSKDGNTLGNLPANIDENTLKVLNHDLYTKFVKPSMYYDTTSKKYYGTRASVVAAARFLILQFPYDIAYYRIGTGENTTTSHYAWAQNGEKRAESATNTRIFGFNLSKKAYSDYTSEKTVKVMKNGKEVDAVPWGAKVVPPASYREEKNGKKCKNTKYREETPNGLECSGFVSWAFRNGRFNLGDWATRVFAKNGKCGKDTRNYLCSSVVNAHTSSGNPNNYFDSTFSKLGKLKESDFFKVKDLPVNAPSNTDEYFKAGDLLWRACYTFNNSDASYSGHVAMILGVHKTKSETYIYVGEAVGGAGNTLTSYTWSKFRSSGWAAKPDSCKSNWEGFLIRMDNVYNYHKTQKNVSVDLNTYKYSSDFRN